MFAGIRSRLTLSHRFWLCIAAVALGIGAGTGVAACGGDDDDEGTTAEETTASTTETTGGGVDIPLPVSAAPDGSLAFEENSLRAAVGVSTFEFTNDSSVSHDFCIEQDGSEIGCTDVIAGDTTTLDANLPKTGEYTFYCSVDGHRESGMEGTLTVK